MKLKYIGRTLITKLILENDYYDINLLKYDNDTKRILYNSNTVEPKLEAFKFGMYFSVECKISEFQDALYALARLNTLDMEETLHPLCEPINSWLIINNKSEVKVIEIITDCLKGKLMDLTSRQSEIIVGKCLRQLGWIKHKRNKYNIWLKPKVDKVDN